MRQIGISIAVAFFALAMWATPSAAASVSSGYTSAAVHQRVGPGTIYPVVQTIPAGAPVQIFGCLTGLTWCDTLYAGKRGWVSGRYLTLTAQGQRRPVVTFGFAFGVPLVGPWWDFPGHWPPPPPKHGGPPPHPPGPPPHHEPGPGDGGPKCGVPGKPPCGDDHADRGRDQWPSGRDGPQCGVPGKPPCHDNAAGEYDGRDRPFRRNDR